jgi:hypothetical protein
MANVTPKQVFGDGYSFDAATGTISINLSDLLPLGELVNSEADGTTGNGVKVAYALVKTFTNKLAALDEIDQPTRMSAFEGSYSTNTDDTVSRSYSQTFQFSVGDVADEI